MIDRTTLLFALPRVPGPRTSRWSPTAGAWCLWESVAQDGGCPSCEVMSTRVKDSLICRLNDLPHGSVPQRLWVWKRRFVCGEELCSRRSFTEVSYQVPARFRLTMRLRTRVSAAVTVTSRAMSEVAGDYGVAWWTVHASRLDYSLLVRTDFSNDAHWQQLIDEAQRENEDGFRASIEPVNDLAFDGTSWEAVKAAVPANENGTAVLFIADGRTLSSPDGAIVVVNLLDDGSKTPFRSIPSELWSIDNNLNIAKMDWEEFGGAADEDGVSRGFDGFDG